MAFEDKDREVLREISERVVGIHKDRNDSYEEEPKLDIHVVKIVDGPAVHMKLTREAVVELYTAAAVMGMGAKKRTHEDWDLETIDACEVCEDE